MLDALELA